MIETKNLEKRGTRWWIKLRVPLDVRRLHPTEPAFVRRNLRTSDVHEARRTRHEAIGREHVRWAKLRENRPAGADDIKRLAEREMHRQYHLLASRLLEVGESLDRLKDEAGAAIFLGKIDDAAEALLRSEGYVVTKESARALADKMGVAARLAITALQTGMKLPDNATPTIGDGSRGTTLEDAIRDYLKEKRRPGANAMTAKTIAQAEKSLNLLRGFLPAGIPIRDVGRDAAGRFVAALIALSPDYRRDPKAADLGLKELVEKHPAGDGKGLSAATLKRHTSNIRGLWSWAERGLVVPGSSPWERLALPRVGDVDGHLPYTMEELGRLVAALPMASADVAFAFRVGLFTGMRQGEIARMDGIALEAAVPYFDLMGARRKTRAGKRCVPIHPALLPHMVGIQPLDVEPSVLGKRYTRWKLRAGVTRPGTDFHSLRKNVAEALERAGVAESEAALILGHKTGRGFTYSVYSPNGPGMERLARAVAMIAYPGVDMGHSPEPQSESSAT